jgi:SH3 domain-containing YSC84-like protein 1
MQRFALMVSITLSILTGLSSAAAKNCKDCHCTSFPVNKGCESCCQLREATRVIEQMAEKRGGQIPETIAAKATCVGVVPGLKEPVFAIDNQHGQGVVTCRTDYGWSAPVFIRVDGGSFAPQMRQPSTDLLLIAVNRYGFHDLLKNKFKIGVDATAAAGPVGRNGQLSGEFRQNSGLLTYSSSRGLLAGVDLVGTVVAEDKDITDAFYDSSYSFDQILKGNISPPEGAKPFLRAVRKYFGKVQQ